ncbi:hypothetical protein CLOM_g21203 [Closterium sp. NIES-68]|nr:hypothetical protein CLOM_g21203 [Closterium sp. NIES-68]
MHHLVCRASSRVPCIISYAVHHLVCRASSRVPCIISSHWLNPRCSRQSKEPYKPVVEWQSLDGAHPSVHRVPDQPYQARIISKRAGRQHSGKHLRARVSDLVGPQCEPTHGNDFVIHQQANEALLSVIRQQSAVRIHPRHNH